MLILRMDNGFGQRDTEREMEFKDAAALCAYLLANPIREGSERYIMTGLDLSGQDLGGVYLRNALMFDCNFQGANLSGADLRNAGVIQSDFSGADMTGVNLVQTSMTAAKFRETKMPGCQMSATVGTEADFTGADFSGSRIGASGFERAVFDGADFSRVEFQNGVRFAQASMQNTNFSGATAGGSIDARDVDFSGAIMPAHMRAQLNGVMKSAPNMDAASLRRQHIKRIAMRHKTGRNNFGI